MVQAEHDLLADSGVPDGVVCADGGLISDAVGQHAGIQLPQQGNLRDRVGAGHRALGRLGDPSPWTPAAGSAVRLSQRVLPACPTTQGGAELQPLAKVQ